MLEKDVMNENYNEEELKMDIDENQEEKIDKKEELENYEKLLETLNDCKINKYVKYNLWKEIAGRKALLEIDIIGEERELKEKEQKQSNKEEIIENIKKLSDEDKSLNEKITIPEFLKKNRD